MAKKVMSYKIYLNRRTRNHPAIEVESDDATWKNLEVTSSPTKKGKYIELDDSLGNQTKNPLFGNIFAKTQYEREAIY